MSDKPVFLLDVDGVINACQYKLPTTWPEDTWRRTTARALNGEFPILYSTEVIDFINRMADVVEIRWHTTWQHEALALGRQLGIEAEFEVADAPEFDMYTYKMSSTWYNGPHGWWKMAAALRVVNDEERPLIWADDDLFGWNKDIFWSHAESFYYEVKLVTPLTEWGLTPDELEGIEDFAETFASDSTDSLS